MATTLYKSKLQINDTIIAFKDATLGSTVLALGTVVTDLSNTVDNLSGENIPIEHNGSTIAQWLNEHDEVIAYALNDLNTRIGDGLTVAEQLEGLNLSGDYVAKSSIIVPNEYTNLEPDSDIILATIAGTPIKVHTANETDENVKQTLTSESNDLPIIVKKSTTTTETTTGVSFSNSLSYNPATKTLKANGGSIFASGIYGTVANFGTVNIGTLTIGNTVNSISNSSTETSTGALLTAKAIEDKITGKGYVTKASVQFPINGTKISYGVTTIIGTVGGTPLKIEIDSDEQDYRVQQSQITTAGAMPIIIKTASTTVTATTTVGFNGDFTYNPSSKLLTVQNATITNATIINAKINSLNATTGNISTVNSSVINSTTVNASTNNVNTTNSTTLNVTGTGNIKGINATIINGSTITTGTLTIGSTVTSISNASTETSNSALLTAKAIEDKVTGKLNSYVTKSSVVIPAATQNLSHNTDYVIATIAGTGIKVKVVSDNTDYKVQHSQVTSGGALPIIIKSSSSTSTATTTVGFNGDFTYDPGTKILKVPNANISSVSTINTANITTGNITTGNINTGNFTTVKITNASVTNLSVTTIAATNARISISTIATGYVSTVFASTIYASSIPGYVTEDELKLTSNYTKSASSNADLNLKPLDTYQTAFSKLHKAILDNEETIAAALIDINDRIGDGYTVDEKIAEAITGNNRDYVASSDIHIPNATPDGVHDSDIILATIGASSIKLHLPADNDSKVNQASTTTSGSFPIILKKTANNTNTTDGVLYGISLTYNPGANILSAPNINISTTATVNTANITIGNITNANITTGSVTNLKSTNATATNVWVNTITGTNAKFINGTVTDLWSTTATITTLNGISVSDYVKSSDVTVANPHATLNWGVVTTVGTVKGKAFKIKMPELPNDLNDKVSQASTTTSSAFPILLKKTANNTNTTDGVLYGISLTYNPNTNILAVPNANISTVATINTANITTGNINTANITTGSVTNLKVTNGTVGNAWVNTITGTNAKFTNGTVINLWSTTATITTLNGISVSDYVKSSDVTVANPHATLNWGAVTTVGTVKGKAFKVKMPDNPNTDYRVQQIPIATNAAYPIIFKGLSAVASVTGTTAFKSNLTYNPNTNILAVPNANISTVATINTANITTANVTTGNITNVSGTKLTYTNATIISGTTGTFVATSLLKGSTITGTVINGKTINSSVITTATITADVLKSTNASITTLTATTGLIINLTASSLIATSLNTQNIHFNIATGDTLTASTINASSIPGFAKIEDLALGSTYEMSELVNDDLNLLPLDTYETAFGKIHKAIIDNEQIITAALIDLNTNKLDRRELILSETYAISTAINENLELLPSDSYEVAFSKLHKAIIDDEEITSAAINELNDNKVESSQLHNLIQQELFLTPEYEMSVLSNASLNLEPNDSYETAFGKLHKAIIDNEQVISMSIFDLYDTKLSKVDSIATIDTIYATTLNVASIEGFISDNDVNVPESVPVLNWNNTITVATIGATPIKISTLATPSDINVQQSQITTAGAMPIIIKTSASTSTATTTVGFNGDFTYNPNTKLLSVQNATITSATINTLNGTAIGNYVRKFDVTGGTPALSWGATSQIGVVGGKSFAVKMPANPNTDKYVEQVPNSTNAAMPIIFKSGSAVSTATTNVSFKSGFTYNPNSNILAATNINISNIATVTTGNFTNIKSTNGTITNLWSTTANITTLNGSAVSDYVKSIDVAITSPHATLDWGSIHTIGTVKGKAFKVKMPANPNVDSKVQQDPVTTNAALPILLKTNANTTTATTTVAFKTNLTYNPSSNVLSVPNAVITNATITTATVTNLNGSAVSDYVKSGDISVGTPALSWNATTQIGTIKGKSFGVKLPANPNTDRYVEQVPNSTNAAMPIIFKSGSAVSTATTNVSFKSGFTFNPNSNTLAVTNISITNLNGSAVSDYVKSGDISIGTPALSWNATTQIGTIKGKSFGVKLPANPNTDYKVQQDPSTTNAALPILLKTNANTTSATTTVVFKTNLSYNPSSNILSVPNATITTATVTTAKITTANITTENSSTINASTINAISIPGFVKTNELASLIPTPALSSTYQMSILSGTSLEPQPNDSYEVAIGKLHKSIIEFEYIVAAALNDINARLNKLNI